jgi:rod shape-determining protein MreD
MMGKRLAGIAFTLWACAILQQALAHRLAIFGAKPDFLLIALTLISLSSTRAVGITVGFLDGALWGALSGANMTQYVISRAFTGMVLAWGNGLNLKRSSVSVALLSATGVVIAGIVFMFLAAPNPITSYLAGVLKTAIYNSILVAPLAYAGAALRGDNR